MRRVDLAGRPTSRAELSTWYAAALESQAGSGLSVGEYAQRMGVTAATLYQWRRRLSAEVRDRARLVEVTVAPARGIVDSQTIVVRVGDGRRSIEVPRGFDSDDLRRLVTVLESC